jgi:hypothetical protein
MRWAVTGLVFAAALAVHATEGKKGYQTTIDLQNSAGLPVAGTEIRIQLDCGIHETVQKTTDSHGEVRFAYSLTT